LSVSLAFPLPFEEVAMALPLSASFVEDADRVKRFSMAGALDSSGREDVSMDGGGVTS
jgi:hypothetical protein